jgi:multidrug efflux system outer membrane protein
MAPEYVRPRAPVPDTWTGPGAADATTAGAPLVAWQDYFGDPKLRAVVDLALQNSRDLKVAVLNVERAAALYRIQRAALYPGVGAGVTADVSRVPEKVSGSDDPKIAEFYQVGFGTTTWELDLFGRIRSLRDAALQQYLATEHAKAATQISLIAAVVSTYLSLAADRDGIALARNTFDTQQSTLALIQKTRDIGTGSGLEVEQARSQVELARVQIARFEGFAATDRNLLDMLTGAPVPADLLPQALGPVTQVRVTAGVPSEVLLRRPDILAAEAQLRAANANIGAARAAFFPTISLTGTLGSASADLSGLLQSGTGSWSFTPRLTTPIFAGGALRANLKVSEVNRDLAVAQYEKAIQGAFREVSDALSLRTTLLAQQEAQTALVAALDKAYRLSEARYKAGLDGYLGVLVQQASLFNAQQTLVGVRLAEQVNAVVLFKVLGGGV